MLELRVLALTTAFLIGSTAIAVPQPAETEAAEFLKANRQFLLAVANGRALARTVVEAEGCDGGEVCGIGADSMSFLNGKSVVLKGTLVDVDSRLFGPAVGFKAKVMIGRCRQQPVNVKCHLTDSAAKSLKGVNPGRLVIVKGRVGGQFGNVSALVDGCVMTLEESDLVDGQLYARAEAALPFAEDELLGDCLVAPRPFFDLNGSARRELVEMARCAEAAYPDGEIPFWYRPLSRDEWRAAAAEVSYSDDIYSDDGFMVAGNGLRGRLMAHRLTGRTVIAWSGCDLDGGLGQASLDDFRASALPLLGGDVNAQFSQALEVCRGILKTRRGEVWVVGHSLGGSIATYVSLAAGDCEGRLKCASLNGLGVSGVLCEKLGAEARRLAGRRTVNLYCDKDPVYSGHRLLARIGVAPRHFGRSYYVEYLPSDGAPGAQAKTEFESMRACHGISELRRLADAQAPSAASEPAAWCVVALVVSFGVALGLVLQMRRRRKS